MLCFYNGRCLQLLEIEALAFQGLILAPGPVPGRSFQWSIYDEREGLHYLEKLEKSVWGYWVWAVGFFSIAHQNFIHLFPTLWLNIYTGWVELYSFTIVRAHICHIQVKTAAPYCAFVTMTLVGAVRLAPQPAQVRFQSGVPWKHSAIVLFICLIKGLLSCVWVLGNTWRYALSYR